MLFSDEHNFLTVYHNLTDLPQWTIRTQICHDGISKQLCDLTPPSPPNNYLLSTRQLPYAFVTSHGSYKICAVAFNSTICQQLNICYSVSHVCAHLLSLTIIWVYQMALIIIWQPDQLVALFSVYVWENCLSVIIAWYGGILVRFLWFIFNPVLQHTWKLVLSLTDSNPNSKSENVHCSKVWQYKMK